MFSRLHCDTGDPRLKSVNIYRLHNAVVLIMMMRQTVCQIPSDDNVRTFVNMLS